MKINGLPPTLRERTRYVAFSVQPDEGVKLPDIKTVENDIEQAVLQYIGVKGAAEAGAYVVETASSQEQIVVRCGSKHVQDLLMAVSLKPPEHYRLNSLHVSGVLSNIKDKPVTKRNKRENRKRVL